ncbi:MAG: peptidoglycan-associated lipoprotein Pal [Nitrospirae bacterium]|nr:peptidoglycan-associated lipoprotein Pal [Nitrospirota bacterium]
MKKSLAAVMAIVSIIAFSGCAQKKVATVDQTSAPVSAQTKPADREAPAADSKKIPTESVTSLDKDKKETVPAYVRELQAKVQDVYFAYDKYDLSDDAIKAVKTVGDILTKNKKVKVTIEGHSDERGTNEYNLALGDRRAKVAKDYLISLGIPANRIELISYGEEKPACTESSETCWAKNRRDHFVLSE